MRAEHVSHSDSKTVCTKACCDLMQVVEKIRPLHTPFLNLQIYCPADIIHLYTTLSKNSL